MNSELCCENCYQDDTQKCFECGHGGESAYDENYHVGFRVERIKINRLCDLCAKENVQFFKVLGKKNSFFTFTLCDECFNEFKSRIAKI